MHGKGTTKMQNAANNTSRMTFVQLARQQPTASRCSTLSLGDANNIEERFQHKRGRQEEQVCEDDKGGLIVYNGT